MSATYYISCCFGDNENSIKEDTDRIARKKEHRRTRCIEKVKRRDYEQGMLCLRIRTKVLLQN